MGQKNNPGDMPANTPYTEQEFTSLISFYDKVEVYPDCTVEVLTNTKTGEVSVGWWKNNPDEEAIEW